MKGKLQRKATIVTTSELATDYRLLKLSKSLEEAGYLCNFVCRIKDNHLPFTQSNKKVIYLNTIWQSSPLFYLFYNLRIFFFLIFHKADLIVSIDLDTLVGCGLAKLFKKSKLLFDSHEYFPESPEINKKPWIKAIWRLAEKLFIPIVDIGVTVCQPIADIYKRKYNKDFLVIRNAPLSERIAKLEHERKQNSKFTLLYQGAVNYGRALKQLIKAMEYIDNAELIIVGDGDIFNELKTLSIMQRDKITLTGKVPFEDLPCYTSQADLGIALLENIGLNNYYALPNRLFDALQAELPMLGIDFPEIKRFIKENNFGTTISSIEPQDIAYAINQIKNNPKQLYEWRKNASVTKTKVNWENETAKLKSTLTQL